MRVHVGDCGLTSCGTLRAVLVSTGQARAGKAHCADGRPTVGIQAYRPDTSRNALGELPVGLHQWCVPSSLLDQLLGGDSIIRDDDRSSPTKTVVRGCFRKVGVQASAGEVFVYEP